MSSRLLTKRRTSHEQPTRRISGPVEGSFSHVATAMSDSASPVASGIPIASASTSAQPAAKSPHNIARRLTKTFFTPFNLSSSSISELDTSLISSPVPGSFTSSPAPISASASPAASPAASALVFPSRSRQARNCRATYCAPSTTTQNTDSMPPRAYTTHSQRHQSVSFAPRRAESAFISSDIAPGYPQGSPSFAAYAPLSGDTTPALGSYAPRTTGDRPKRIARKPVPATALADVDFGTAPRLTLSPTYTSNVSDKRKSTAKELEGGLFAPAPVQVKVEDDLAAPAHGGEEALATRLTPTWFGRRSPSSSPRLDVSAARPYPLGHSPALPPLPATISLADALTSVTSLHDSLPDRHCPSPAASSCSAYSASSASSSASEVLTVPRLSTGSDTSVASAASSSCTCPATGSWQWGHPQAPASPRTPSPYAAAAYRLGTPSMEDSRGRNAKRSSVWLPTRVQSGGKMFQLSPALGSLSPAMAEDSWARGGEAEQWSGDVLEITLARS